MPQTILWYLDEFHSVFICFLSLAPRYIPYSQLYWANRKKIFRLRITSSRLNFLFKFYWYSFHFVQWVRSVCLLCVPYIDTFVQSDLNKKKKQKADHIYNGKSSVFIFSRYMWWIDRQIEYMCVDGWMDGEIDGQVTSV